MKKLSDLTHKIIALLFCLLIFIEGLQVKTFACLGKTVFLSSTSSHSDLIYLRLTNKYSDFSTYPPVIIGPSFEAIEVDYNTQLMLCHVPADKKFFSLYKQLINKHDIAVICVTPNNDESLNEASKIYRKFKIFEDLKFIVAIDASDKNVSEESIENMKYFAKSIKSESVVVNYETGQGYDLLKKLIFKSLKQNQASIGYYKNKPITTRLTR